jgi:hypothetical protein
VDLSKFESDGARLFFTRMTIPCATTRRRAPFGPPRRSHGLQEQMPTGIEASRYFFVDDSLTTSVTTSVPHKISSRYPFNDPLTMSLTRSPSAIHREISSHDRDPYRFRGRGLRMSCTCAGGVQRTDLERQCWPGQAEPRIWRGNLGGER